MKSRQPSITRRFKRIKGFCKVCGDKKPDNVCWRDYCSRACFDRAYAYHGWQSMRKYVFRRDGGICQICGMDIGKLDRVLRHAECRTVSWVRVQLGFDSHNYTLFHTDHIRAVVDGGSDEPENLRTLCHECHKAETKQLAARRADDRKLNGSLFVSSLLSLPSRAATAKGGAGMTFLSLFAGIGGLDLGLERAGMRCIGQVEIDPFCRRILSKEWPHIKRMEDVRDVKGNEFGEFDLVCGGFPCQDISNAGRRTGIGGERSGLWSEFHRIIRDVRPAWVLVENVAALLGRGLDVVLWDLAAIRYDAEWHCIPASAVGAPHLRDRVFIVAYPAQRGFGADGRASGQGGYVDERGENVADAKNGTSTEGKKRNRRAIPNGCCSAITADVPNTDFPQLERAGLRRAIADCPEWLPEPGICRVANGVSDGVDRLRSLGNAVVPKVAEVIGRLILDAEKRAAKAVRG